ncbi:hypothetical protein BJ138DRAFT_857189 [Hygrophoropsis aurantiaca]|uniref:Uncharacterized protein n=1 Tax=Hygrophoropsis aurantiaca TaxID=72124 RepID=A0ACB7ZUY6_9AGAM|nr:hypothetical protein BJ138DRAFT_857189 [Hygrophoropsis aurantiaca]
MGLAIQPAMPGTIYISTLSSNAHYIVSFNKEASTPCRLLQIQYTMKAAPSSLHRMTTGADHMSGNFMASQNGSESAQDSLLENHLRGPEVYFHGDVSNVYSEGVQSNELDVSLHSGSVNLENSTQPIPWHVKIAPPEPNYSVAHVEPLSHNMQPLIVNTAPDGQNNLGLLGVTPSLPGPPLTPISTTLQVPSRIVNGSSGSICNVSIRVTQSKVRRYLKTHGVDVGGTTPTVRCPRAGCDADLMRGDNVARHIVSCHIKAGRVSCGTCGKTFVRRDALGPHVAIGRPCEGAHAVPVLASVAPELDWTDGLVF